MPAPIRRSRDLRTENRRRVIQSLRALGSCSRVALGEATGLSPAAISSFASELIAEGVVVATRRALGRGRPQSMLALAPSAATMLTASLTIDQLDLQLLDYTGVVLQQACHELDTRALDQQGLITTVTTAMDRLVAQSAAPPLQQVSIGFQGVTGHLDGELVWSPILSIGHVPLGRAISQHFGIEVSVANDCRLIADALHAEQRVQLGRSFATVLFSSGVGLALTINDQAFAGVTTSAMEFGHLQHERDGALCRCGQRGCIEAYAADYAITRAIERYRCHSNSGADSAMESATGRQPSDMLRTEAEAAIEGDPGALAAFDAAGSAIGQGLQGLFLLLGPMPVALVGRSPAVVEAMRPRLVAALEAANPAFGELGRVTLLAVPEDDRLLQRGLVYNATAAVDKRLAGPRGVDVALSLTAMRS